MICSICLSALPEDVQTCPRCRYVTTEFLFRPNAIDLSVAHLPPEDLVFRVMGNKDGPNPIRFLSSGREVAQSFVRALDQVDRRLRDFEQILDFGAGCGRVLRWLLPKAPKSTWGACDIDEPAIEWVGENLPVASAIATQPLPALPFDDGQFDLVLGYSIFTHLPGDYQDAWLEELARVTRPGGTLLLTVHGSVAYEDAAAASPAHAQYMEAFNTEGFVYVSNDYWKDHFPAYYQTAYHHPSYVRRHWSQWLEVDAVLELGAYPNHDVVVARKP